jgi:hypothetical protein
MTKPRRPPVIVARMVTEIFSRYRRLANGPCALVLVLISGFGAITPLAYATPPGDAWVAGIWDAADSDEVIGLIDMLEVLAHNAAALGTVDQSLHRPCAMENSLHRIGVAPRSASDVSAPPRGRPIAPFSLPWS